MARRFAPAYNTATRNKWLGQLGFSGRFGYTLEKCQAAAAQCSSRAEMDVRFPGEYGYAKRNGLLDLLGLASERTVPAGHWTQDNCAAVAARCHTLAEMRTQFSGAYQAAYRNGWLDAYGLPKKAQAQGAIADTFYMWEAVGVLYDGMRVYKVGVAGWGRAQRRMAEVAKAMGVERVVRLLVKAGADKTHAQERFALALGVNPRLHGANGCTEFRAYTPAELQRIYDFVLPRGWL